MIKRIFLAIALLLGFIFPSLSQSAEYVVGTASGMLVSSSSSHDYSVGEMEVAIITDGSSTITSGFLQPDFVTLDISAVTVSSSVLVFPNPAQSYVQVQFEKAAPHHISVLSSSGEILTEMNSIESADRLDLSDYASGFYIVRINVQGGLWSKNIKILKL